MMNSRIIEKAQAFLRSCRDASLLLLMLGSFALLSAQDAGMSTYNRNGITFLRYGSLLPPEGAEAFTQAFNTLSVPSKFDNNMLPGIDMGVLNSVPGSSLEQRLQAAKIPNMVVDHLFSEQEGKWSMDLLFERAAYNMSDAEAVMLQNSFVGVERGLQDAAWTETLLQNNFIVILEFTGFTPADSLGSVQALNAFASALANQANSEGEGNKEEPKAEPMVGYGSAAKAHVFRIDLNPQVLEQLYTNCWADASSSPDEIQQAIQARANMTYRIERIGTYSSDAVRSTRKKEGFNGDYTGMMQTLVNKGVRSAMNDVEAKVDAFMVRSDILFLGDGAIQKVYSKIGRKEGVGADDRYYVYEQVLKRNGNVQTRYRGVLRARKVADNRDSRLGQADTSEFIQVSGAKLDRGMIIREKPDKYGISITPVFGNQGPGLRGEILLSKWVGSGRGFNLYIDLHGKNYNDLPDIRVFDGVGGLDTYDSKVYQGSFAIGIAQEFNLWRNFMIEPYIGYHQGSFSFSDTTLDQIFTDERPQITLDNGVENLTRTVDYTETVQSVEAGVRLGIAMGPRLQAIGTVGFFPSGKPQDGTIFSGDLRMQSGGREDNPFEIDGSSMLLEFGIRIIL